MSNLDKVLFPTVKFTKGQLIDYYIRIADFVLPHLRERPITLKRYPDGITGEHFYEKNAPKFTPDWIKTARVWRVSGESQIRYILINDLPTLVWCSNLANIELHTLLSKAPKTDRPTSVVFDLDPGPPAGVLECAQVAVWLRNLLDQLKLKSFVKSSGSKGLHFYVPLNTPVTYETTQALAKALATSLEQAHPDQVVSVMAKEARGGKVFIDWSQNTAHKTTVCVYSLRAKKEQPFVSMPMKWEEVERAIKKKDPDAFYFSPEAALKRCEKLGDLFAPMLRLKQKLPSNLAKILRDILPEETPSRSDRTKETPLQAYDAKRDFTQTQEPPPKVKPSSKSKTDRLFVIQKHAASHLHYDFRLEMDGVLKSWAVPKGPPYERNEKRLAMQVEDHPLDYARFEGTIPPGNYGAGTVMVWDIGTYEVMDGNVYAGKLHLRLKGKKLKGEWILVQTHREEDKRPWFLIKGGTSMPRISARRDDTSAITGRSLKKIAADNNAQWTSHR